MLSTMEFFLFPSKFSFSSPTGFQGTQLKWEFYGRMGQWWGVEGEQANKAIIHLVGLNGWPPSVNTKEWSQPNSMVASSEEWWASAVAGVKFLDIRIEKTDLNNDIFLFFKRNSNIVAVICDYFPHCH